MTPRLTPLKRPDAAFESLYRRHVQDVYGYALALLGSRTDAEDVTQATFLNAFRAFERGERPRKPGDWLRAIARNLFRHRVRQAARRPHEHPIRDDVTGALLDDEIEKPTAEDIVRALRTLPFNQRAALVMRELEGRGQSEIAAQLGVSVSAVETLLFRARRALREQLESSLTCGEAARAVSRQLDGALPRSERAALRAHLRACPECAAFARSARAQRGALRRLGGAPLPASLLSWSGAAGAVTAPATGVGVKLAVIAAVAVTGGSGDDAVRVLKHWTRADPTGTTRSAPPASRAPRPDATSAATGSDARAIAGSGTRVQPLPPDTDESGTARAAARPARAEAGRRRPAKHHEDHGKHKPRLKGKPPKRAPARGAIAQRVKAGEEHQLHVRRAPRPGERRAAKRAELRQRSKDGGHGSGKPRTAERGRAAKAKRHDTASPAEPSLRPAITTKAGQAGA
jgi:RNA polymerase sigma factor (sigma-70 family)